MSFPGNQLVFMVFPEAVDGSVTPFGYLVMALAFSVFYSLFAGFCSAMVAGINSTRLGVSSGFALLAVGLAVQISYWDALPIWYHLIFLASIVPFTVIGSRLFRVPRTSEVSVEK